MRTPTVRYLAGSAGAVVIVAALATWVAHAQQAPVPPAAPAAPEQAQPQQPAQEQQPSQQAQQQPSQQAQQQPSQQAQQQPSQQAQQPAPAQPQPRQQAQQRAQQSPQQAQQAQQAQQPGPQQAQRRPLSTAQTQQLLERPIGENAVEAQLAHPTGDPSTSSVLVSRRAAPEIRVGEAYRYTIQVQNVTDQPLAAVSVTEVLGEGIDIVAAEPWGESGANGQFRWLLGTLQANESKTIEVAAIPSEPGSYASCLAVQYEPALCAVLEVTNPQIRLSKQGPDQAYMCDEIVYRYAVSNTGTGEATNVVVRDVLPKGLASFDGEGEVTYEFDSIGPGETAVFEARTRPSAPGQFTSRAIAVMGEQQVYSEPVSTQVYQPQLAVQVSAPQWQYSGQPVNYTVQVANTGDVPAPDAVVTIEAPGLDVDDSEHELGTLRPGETKAFNVTLRGRSEDSNMRLVAVAESRCAEPQRAMAATELRNIPALLLETVDNRDPVPLGETTVYTVVVKNQGTGPAENVTLTAEVPPQLEIVGSRGETEVQQEGSQLRFSPLGSLAPGELATWLIEARANEPGDVQFRVEMSSEFLQQPTPDVEPTRLIAEDAPAQARQPGGALGAEEGRSETARETEQTDQIDRPQVRIGATPPAEGQPQAQPQQPQQPQATPTP